MAKKATAKKATKKAAPKKAVKKPAKKKAAKKKSQLVISFKETKEDVGVQITGTHVSLQMMTMAHEALGEAIMGEMTGGPKKGK
jgi:peroxiredoxin family protein